MFESLSSFEFGLSPRSRCWAYVFHMETLFSLMFHQRLNHPKHTGARVSLCAAHCTSDRSHQDLINQVALLPRPQTNLITHLAAHIFLVLFSFLDVGNPKISRTLWHLWPVMLMVHPCPPVSDSLESCTLIYLVPHRGFLGPVDCISWWQLPPLVLSMIKNKWHSLLVDSLTLFLIVAVSFLFLID